MTTTSFDTAGGTTWTCPAGITAVDIVVVGGAGGGGAGAQYQGQGGRVATATTEAKVVVVPGTTYAIDVGPGGAGGTGLGGNGVAGGASTIYIGTAPFITSAGGARGGGGTDNHTGDTDGVAGPGSGIGGTGANGGTGQYGSTCASVSAGGTGGAGAGGGGGGGENASWGCPTGAGGAGGHGYVTITYTAASAAFSGTPTSGDKPLTVQFTGPAAQSTYAWDYGDGGVVDNDHQSPEHIYTTAGKRTVILATTNEYGFAVETKSNYITAYFKARMYGVMSMTDSLRRI